MTRPTLRTARSVATDVVTRVLDDDAFAAAALDAELERAAQLDPRDRGLATELVYGTLRSFAWIEKRIARHAKKPNADARIRAALAIAAYQMLVLERVPAFAAVNETVDLLRASRGPKVGGFANAVLRKIANEGRASEEEIAKAPLASLEPALRKAIVRGVGEEGAARLLSGSEPPPLGIRVEDATQRDTWIARLREARPSASFEAGRVSPHAIVARGAGRAATLPGFREGAWSIQEEGSQAIALALGATKEDLVLDACAGRGNKTGLLARYARAVDAADIHPPKLERLREELARLELAPRETFAVDWSKGTGGAKGPYDRVLVDAPCSGTGTLRRRPELALRRIAADLPRLAELQRAILARTATLVKPGGRLVYAVCSVTREEAEEVVEKAEGVSLESTQRLLPQEHGTDGYFIATFKR